MEVNKAHYTNKQTAHITLAHHKQVENVTAVIILLIITTTLATIVASKSHLPV